MNRAAAPPDLAATLRAWPPVAAFIACAIPVAVLVGWIVESELLKRVVPGFVAMNPLTALAFLALGAGLAAIARPAVARACAAASGFAGAAILARYVFGWDLGADRWLFAATLGDNVMAPTTAFNFVLASVALWLAAAPSGRAAVTAQWLALGVASGSMLALTGYAYGIETLYRLASYIAMAVHTAGAFLVIASGLLTLHPEQGLMARLTSPRAGGMMLRRLLVPMTVVPLGLGWAILRGQRAGSYDAAFGFTIMVIALIAFLTAMIWRSAARLDDQDTGRASVEQALRETKAGLEGTVLERTGALQSAVDGIRVELQVLAAAAEEILASSSGLAASATETAASVSAATVTVEEVRQTARVAAGRAGGVSKTAQKAVAVTATGTAATQATVAGMERIRVGMRTLDERIGELDEQTRTIGEIITAVDDMADQSSLLAVNAAIEAAAAGEHGKGFAVVAQELKYLSGQSRAATKRVRAILNEIQKATAAAMATSGQTVEIVATGAAEAERSGAAIVGLGASVGEAAGAAAEIEASSREQLEGINHVAHAMMQINEVSQNNVAEAQRLEDAALQLRELGRRLKELAERHRG